MKISDQRMFAMEDLAKERLRRIIKETDDLLAEKKAIAYESAVQSHAESKLALIKRDDQVRQTTMSQIRSAEEYQDFLKSSLRII